MRHIWRAPPPPALVSSDTLRRVQGSLWFHWKSTMLSRWPQCWNSRPGGAPWYSWIREDAEAPAAPPRSQTLSSASSPPLANTPGCRVCH